MGPSEDIPPAFRGRRSAAGFIGLEDHDVLAIAEKAFQSAQQFPIASRERALMWDKFDDAMSELAARGLRHILRKLRERGEA